MLSLQLWCRIPITYHLCYLWMSVLNLYIQDRDVCANNHTPSTRVTKEAFDSGDD